MGGMGISMPKLESVKTISTNELGDFCAVIVSEYLVRICLPLCLLTSKCVPPVSSEYFHS